MTLSTDIHDNDLRDKCADVQAKLRLDDLKWRYLFGNDLGLYGFVTALLHRHQLQGRIEELESFFGVAGRNIYESSSYSIDGPQLASRLAELNKEMEKSNVR